MSKAELKRRDKFTKAVIGRTVMGVTIEDGSLALVMDDDSVLLVWEEDGDVQAWAGYPCDD